MSVCVGGLCLLLVFYSKMISHGVRSERNNFID